MDTLVKLKLGLTLVNIKSNNVLNGYFEFLYLLVEMLFKKI